MYHGNKRNTSKTVRYETEEPRHKNAIPYNRSKSKKDFCDYKN